MQKVHINEIIDWAMQLQKYSKLRNANEHLNIFIGHPFVLIIDKSEYINERK